LENAKARLNQYFQKEKIQGEYKYTQVGPDHNRFACFTLPSIVS
jgi:ATP-dependent RNA helicase A